MSAFEFYENMQKAGFVTGNWRNILKLLDSLWKEDNHRDNVLKVFVLLFSRIDGGNAYLLMDNVKNRELFDGMIDGALARLLEKGKEDDGLYESLRKEIHEIDFGKCPLSFSRQIMGEGSDGLFAIREGNKLYTRMHFNAAESVLYSQKRLFADNSPIPCAFNPDDCTVDGFTLTDGQKEILRKGTYNNLLITGGPGTGKTTSVFFLLLSLLLANPSYDIYLTAPSGKAASRMKDSILGSIGALTGEAQKQYANIIEKINTLNEYTIHRFLSYSPQDNEFRHNAENQFKENSIFVVDEASMVDLSLFASLLESIPNGARLFILGDKNQLPSVDVGQVFAELLSMVKDNNIVTLTESKRFPTNSEIYRLSDAVNTGSDLSYVSGLWKKYSDFDPNDVSGGSCTPITFVSDSHLGVRESVMVEEIAGKWAQKFYQKDFDFIKKCQDIPEAADTGCFNEIWEATEKARILCANNDTARGSVAINKYIIKEFYQGKATRYSGHYPGELLMITQNNSQLDLYNGDCGVTVKFENDETIYLMLKKGTSLKLDEQKVENRIFKIGDYLFYPVRFISSEDITYAFAITIHKSQGSDYNNILVILPKVKGHPLLNRQIVYTAITRTKKNTFLLSNQENLECARDTVLIRDTF